MVRSSKNFNQMRLKIFTLPSGGPLKKSLKTFKNIKIKDALNHQIGKMEKNFNRSSYYG